MAMTQIRSTRGFIVSQLAEFLLTRKKKKLKWRDLGVLEVLKVYLFYGLVWKKGNFRL